MQFKGVWRDYQRQVLDDVVDYVANGRLHVVAAPGAGKTILGLEIMRRLGRRAVVFTPTVAIRDQWAQRLTPLFLDEPPGPDEISYDLAAPRQLTLATYQALDTFRRSDSIDALVRSLSAAGPISLVLDEAHHLRREWCNSLEQLASGLPDVRIVALTATPPYDASFAEWARYESLCGPIDLEIGIPELVRNGDLCPHQDHLVLSAPTEDALKLLDERRRAIWELQRVLWEDEDLLDELEQHPWLQAPEDHVEAILDAPEMLSAILVLLASARRKPPRGPLKLLGVPARQIPSPSYAWLERLLDGLLVGHANTFRIGAARQKAWRDHLHKHGLIEGGRVRLRVTRSIFKLMASNLAKLDSVSEIARREHDALGDQLRMVILSDHIRAGELPPDAQAAFRPSKLGVIPIFEHLRRSVPTSGPLGVLTGTLVVIPRAALSALTALAVEHGMDRLGVGAFEIPACPDHLRIEVSGASGARLVQLVTALFMHGDIRVLVGTQSLLGEGWDAPALNSLVLASNTASFVLSNQMRGRAIRVEPGNPGKVANIWHLATVEPPRKDLLAEVSERLNWGDLADDDAGLSDLATLKRRFRAFEGISNGDSTLIESGIGRLGLDLAQDLTPANSRTFAAAANRPAITRRWSASLGVGGDRAHPRETAAPNYAPRQLAWSDTLHALGWGALSAATFAIAEALQDVATMEDIAAIGTALAAAAALAALPKIAKAVRLIWRNGSIEGSLHQVGLVILEALLHAGLATEGDVRDARFEIRSSVDGRKDVLLRGVSRSTERQVMQAIAEVLGPVQNPRHLLVRSSRLGWRARADYHAVPAALAARKAWAEKFAALWARRVGSSRLVYTRTPEGRRVLLRARAKSFAAAFQRSVDRRSAWL